MFPNNCHRPRRHYDGAKTGVLFLMLIFVPGLLWCVQGSVSPLAPMGFYAYRNVSPIYMPTVPGCRAVFPKTLPLHNRVLTPDKVVHFLSRYQCFCNMIVSMYQLFWGVYPETPHHNRILTQFLSPDSIVSRVKLRLFCSSRQSFLCANSSGVSAS